MKKPKKTSRLPADIRLFEGFMDEYTGKAEARRVREAAFMKKGTAAKPQTRSVESSMSTYRVQALEQENAALRDQLTRQRYPLMHITLQSDGTQQVRSVSDFEQEYNKPEPLVEDAPKGRKIVLDD